MAESEGIVAWRYRWRKDTAWQFTEDAEKIERLRRACDDRDGTLTNERLPSWVIEALTLVPSEGAVQ